jgi:hypothetical protein
MKTKPMASFTFSLDVNGKYGDPIRMNHFFGAGGSSSGRRWKASPGGNFMIKQQKVRPFYKYKNENFFL